MQIQYPLMPMKAAELIGRPDHLIPVEVVPYPQDATPNRCPKCRVYAHARANVLDTETFKVKARMYSCSRGHRWTVPK